MRKVIAIGIAWVAIVLLAMSSTLTTLAEWVRGPRPQPPTPPGAE
jgi:hypothetical protein